MTFDIGGTLIQPWPSVGHVYAEVAARHGWKDISPVALNRQFAAAWQALTSFNHTRADWAELVDATFGGLITPPPSSTFFPALYQRFAEPDAWHIFQDVAPTLQALVSRGLRLGVVSNWDERLRPLLEKLNLSHYFEVLIISCEVGAPKPSPVIFQRALRQFGLPPEALLHVGDSLEADVRGARGAGLQARWLRRGMPVQAAGEIGSLGELLAVLS